MLRPDPLLDQSDQRLHRLKLRRVGGSNLQACQVRIWCARFLVQSTSRLRFEIASRSAAWLMVFEDAITFWRFWPTRFLDTFAASFCDFLAAAARNCDRGSHRSRLRKRIHLLCNQWARL
jgi:hypothetical protein